MKEKYDFYLASGWFSPEQEQGRQAILEVIKDLNLTVFSPKDEVICPDISSEAEQQNIFEGNLEAIRRSNFVIVNTAGKDMGTIFEAGFSYAEGKKIIYYCEGLEGGFNLMLSQSGICVATNKLELIEHLIKFISNPFYYKKYVGKIE